MNIEVIDGHARLLDSGSRTWLLEIPIVFERFSTGPGGILQFAFQSRLTDVVFDGKQAAHCYLPRGDGDRLASETPIGTRPIAFRDEGGGNNTIVFVVTCHSESGSIPSRLPISVRITFSNLANLIVPLVLIPQSGNGFLTIEIEKRAEPSLGVARLNLFLLLLLVGTMLWWSWRLGPHVYRHEAAFWNAHIISGILGAMLTFLGLSLERLQSWIAIFSDTVAAWKWPELHLNPRLFRAFSLRALTGILGAGLVLTLCLVRETWVTRLDRPNGTMVLDVVSGEEVPQTSVFQKDVVSNGMLRFLLVCAQGDGPPKERFPLGHINRSGVPEPVKLEVYQNGKSIGSKNGMDWLNEISCSPDKREICSVVRHVVCGPVFMDRRRVEDSTVHADVGTDETRLFLEDTPRFELSELEGWIREFSGKRDGPNRLDGVDWKILFRERAGYLQAWKQTLGEKASDGVVSSKDLSVLTERLLQRMENGEGSLDRKSAIETSILLRGLWDWFDGKRRVDPLTSNDLEVVTGALKKSLSLEFSGWMPFVALVELALDIQTSNPGVVGASIHEAVMFGIDGVRFPSQDSPTKQRGTREALFFHYVRAFLWSKAADDLSATQRCDFARRKAELIAYHGGNPIDRLLASRERDGMPDSPKDIETLQRGALRLWSGTNGCPGDI